MSPPARLLIIATGIMLAAAVGFEVVRGLM